MERTLTHALASTSCRLPTRAALPSTRPRSLRVHAIGTSSDLDDQAEKMAAKIKRKKKAEKERKERDEIAKLLPDPAEEESLLADEGSDSAWEDALWDGGAVASAGTFAGGALASLPLEEVEESAAASSSSEPDVPSYRGGDRTAGSAGSRTFTASNSGLPTIALLGAPLELTPEQAALEDFLVGRAVDEGFGLRHEQHETCRNRYALTLRFAELLEEAEQDDVRLNAAPVLPGTSQRVPSWIRASEALIPEMEEMNAAQAAEEEAANEIELQRYKDLILDDVAAAARLLADTDPKAGYAPDKLPGEGDSLDALMDDILPGTSSGMDDAMDYLEDILPGAGSFGFDLSSVDAELYNEDALGLMAGARVGSLASLDEEEEAEDSEVEEGGGAGETASEEEGAEGEGEPASGKAGDSADEAEA